MYNANWFLDHSAVIMGTNASGPLGGFVGTRGWSDSIKIDVRMMYGIRTCGMCEPLRLD